MVSIIHIAPDQVGVKVNNFSIFSDKGIVAQDFGPGWHFGLPLLHKWNIFPSRVRRVEMTKDPRHRSLLGEDGLVVQSSDGDRVMLDLHIFYKIKNGSAYKVLQDSGSGDGHLSVLKSLAKDRLRAVFGTMGAEQFYDSATRDAKSKEALESLQAVLGPRSLEAVSIMIQDVEFEPKYEQKIKDKKLADQEGELNKAQARAAVEKAKVEVIKLETSKQVKLIETNAEAEFLRVKAEADKYVAKIKAEANLYRDELKAKGIMAQAQSEGQIKRSKTRALAGSGGSNLAALEAVSKLKVDSITFPTGGTDWFDIRQMANRFGAKP